MKTASQSPPVFRLRRRTGLATRRELWSFALFASRITGQKVTIDGIQEHHAGKLDTTVPLAPDAGQMTIERTPAEYRPQAVKGLALKSDLRDLAAWLSPALEARDKSNDRLAELGKRQGSALPVPSDDGLLLRKDFIAFSRAACQRLGASFAASDVSGSRDTGDGLHVRRYARTASLVVTTQSRSGHGKACSVEIADPPEDGYYTQKVIEYTWTNGSYTETTTASGTVQGIGPSGTFDACADTDYESTQDGGFDYGTFVSSSTSGTLVAWDSVIAAAEGEIANAGSEVNEWTESWNEVDWATASAPRSEFIDFASSDLGTIYGEGVFGGWNIIHPKFKIANTGQTRLEIEVTHIRSSDLTEEVLDPIVILPGAESDWIDCRMPEPYELWHTYITRVRMGRH